MDPADDDDDYELDPITMKVLDIWNAGSDLAQMDKDASPHIDATLRLLTSMGRMELERVTIDLLTLMGAMESTILMLQMPPMGAD